MNKTKAKSNLLVGVAIFAVVLILLVLAYWLKPDSSQVRNMRLVRQYIDNIAPDWKRFCENHRGFENVEFHVGTFHDGSLSVSGDVPTQDDVYKLKEYIKSTKPPRPVYYSVMVRNLPQSLDERERGNLIELGEKDDLNEKPND